MSFFCLTQDFPRTKYTGKAKKKTAGKLTLISFVNGAIAELYK